MADISTVCDVNNVRIKSGWLLLGLVFLLQAGCGDEVIYVEKPPYLLPPDTAFEFLGYYDSTATITTCGQCHVERQLSWETTGHARAWDDLQASGQAQDFCEGCHSVNERGNWIDEPAGHNLVADVRYRDVQCESCHGPGRGHVDSPQMFQPRASIAAGVGLGDGCGDCHEGSHHPFVNQWEQSAHGSGGAMAYAGGRAACAPCHEGRAALVYKFGETDGYIEKDGTELQRITCAVCHDPHGSDNIANLRAPIDVASEEHLCVRCHSRSGTPPSSRGPHSAQGLLVLGTNVGWIPPNFLYDPTKIVGTHGSDRNPKLCATCHVNPFTVTDGQSGDVIFESKGHSFEAIPCLDAQGLPVPGPCAVDSRSFDGCATAGCHGSGDIAKTYFNVTQARIDALLNQLWDDVNGNQTIDATDGGVLAKVVAQGDTVQLDLTDERVTVAEGALWNGMLAHTAAQPEFGSGMAFGKSFSSHRSSGGGIHNPFLVEALLTASIQAVMDTYGVAPAPGFDLSIHADPPPGLQ
ncbi:MAG: cytochrome c3 family protein [Gemmatimonadota bacterium]|nr:cytochrome c3 family protein [Gemmatimonadota bacterium]